MRALVTLATLLVGASTGQGTFEYGGTLAACGILRASLYSPREANEDSDTPHASQPHPCRARRHRRGLPAQPLDNPPLD